MKLSVLTPLSLLMSSAVMQDESFSRTMRSVNWQAEAQRMETPEIHLPIQKRRAVLQALQERGWTGKDMVGGPTDITVLLCFRPMDGYHMPPPPQKGGSTGSGVHGELQAPPLTEPYDAGASLSGDLIRALTPEGCSPAEFYAALRRTAQGLDEPSPRMDG